MTDQPTPRAPEPLTRAVQAISKYIRTPPGVEPSDYTKGLIFAAEQVAALVSEPSAPDDPRCDDPRPHRSHRGCIGVRAVTPDDLQEQIAEVLDQWIDNGSDTAASAVVDVLRRNGVIR